MQLTLEGDSFGRVVGTIAQNGVEATVTSSDALTAVADLQQAVDSVLDSNLGECFWHEVAGDYRWVFRREGSIVRLAILWSIGTMTGWEHRFWAECDAEEFRTTMQTAFKSTEAFLTASASTGSADEPPNTSPR